jgi:hypothetical protein
LSFEPSKDGIATVISGHSHKPSIIDRDGALSIPQRRAEAFQIAGGGGKRLPTQAQSEIIELDI